jgi:hypothetical protein
VTLWSCHDGRASGRCGGAVFVCRHTRNLPLACQPFQQMQQVELTQCGCAGCMLRVQWCRVPVNVQLGCSSAPAAAAGILQHGFLGATSARAQWAGQWPVLLMAAHMCHRHHHGSGAPAPVQTGGRRMFVNFRALPQSEGLLTVRCMCTLAGQQGWQTWTCAAGNPLNVL